MFLPSNERKRLDTLNQKNGWMFSKKQLLTMITKHALARKNGDVKSMLAIEYRLSSCNYNFECNYVHNGAYNELRLLLK